MSTAALPKSKRQEAIFFHNAYRQHHLPEALSIFFISFIPTTCNFFADLDKITPPSQDLQPQNPSTLLQASHLPLKHHLFALFTLDAFLSNSLTCFPYELINFIFLLVCFVLPGSVSTYPSQFITERTYQKFLKRLLLWKINVPIGNTSFNKKNKSQTKSTFPNSQSETENGPKKKTLQQY